MIHRNHRLKSVIGKIMMLPTIMPSIEVADIGVDTFATACQGLLVEFLKAHDVIVGGQSGRWYEKWWTGARRRYCLLQAQHGGSNNNMGMEVDWRDMKRITPESCFIGTFIGSLMHFITELHQ